MNGKFPPVFSVARRDWSSPPVIVRRRSYDSWPVYGGSKDEIHYSTLRQIDTANVGGLRQVWVYHCGDLDSNSQIQVNPIVVWPYVVWRLAPTQAVCARCRQRQADMDL
jgi:glucose dehydrogenase